MKVNTTKIATAAAALLLVVLGLVLFPSSGRDDSYISFWSAHSLATDGRITNYNGEHVEQSSSLGFVAALALLRRVTGAGVPLLGALLSMLMGMLAVFGASMLAQSITPRAGPAAAWLAATCPPLVYWTMSGMEMAAAAATNIWVAASIAMVLSAGFCALYSVYAERLIAIFDPDPDVIRVGIPFLLIIAIGQLFTGPTMPLAAAMNGAGDTRPPMFAALMANWPVKLPLAYALALPFGFGTSGIWMGMFVSMLLESATLIWWFRRGRWLTKSV